MLVALSPIWRNLPDNLALNATYTNNQYRLSMDSMRDLQLVMSNRELFADALYFSATDVFTTIGPAKRQAKQEVDFRSYFQYLRSESTSLGSHETPASMSHLCLHDNLLYLSHVPGHPRKPKQFCDQLIFPHKIMGLVLHACHDHVSSGSYLSSKPTYDEVHDRFWWPTLLSSRDTQAWCQSSQATNSSPSGNFSCWSRPRRASVSTCLGRFGRIQDNGSGP